MVGRDTNAFSWHSLRSGAASEALCRGESSGSALTRPVGLIAGRFGQRGSSPRSESSESALTRPEGLFAFRYTQPPARSESSGSALTRSVGLRGGHNKDRKGNLKVAITFIRG